MNTISKYGFDLKHRACDMRDVLKEDNGSRRYSKKRKNSFKQYDEQNKLYKKSKFMINLGYAIEKTTL